ncbi:hypothetical protein N9P66_04860 [Salibacteraceae bacterium]|jgi:hypothetical protein|nr:hypothetical protein [Salibacteraceae bacterium]
MKINNSPTTITSLLICLLIFYSCQYGSTEDAEVKKESKYLTSQISSDYELEYIRANTIKGNENLLMYYEKFIRDLEINNIQFDFPKEVIIELVDLEQLNLNGHMHGRSYGINKPDLVEIYINNKSWNDFNRAQKYRLMYHELSHDILNLPDLDDAPENKQRLMYPAMSKYEYLTMDKFIDMFQNDFEALELKQIKE